MAEKPYYGLPLEEFRKKYTRMMEISMRVGGHGRANALLKREGYIDEELTLPRIALYNSWSEQSPGHVIFKDVARAVRMGANLAGAMVVESNLGGAASCLMHYDLPSREAVLNSLETGFHRYADAWIGLCSCDKVVPPMLIAALRIDQPCIIVTGGPTIPTQYKGMTMMMGPGADAGFLYPMYMRGEITDQELEMELRKIADYVGNCPGACAEMTTGNTMSIAAEALGMALPGTAMIPAVLSERIRSSKRAGMQIVNLVEQDIKPTDIITEESMRNAIAVMTATGGGTNAWVHMQALAYEGNFTIIPDDWDKIQRQVPTLLNIAPSDTRSIPNTLYDFYLAGGVPAVMKEIQDQLNLDCLTVTGKTLGENLKAFPKTMNPAVIRPRSNPVWSDGTMVVLKGSLAPVCAVMRHSIIKYRDLLKHNFPAVVFNSIEDAVQSITMGTPKTVEDGQAIVVRYEGPRGRIMRTTTAVNRAVRNAGLYHCCVVTDGRTSGWTRDIPVIVNIVPEAYVGGPLAIVEDGDTIQLNTPKRRIDLDLSEDEIQARLAKWKQPEPMIQKGMAIIYSKIALQADKGGGWPVRWPF